MSTKGWWKPDGWLSWYVLAMVGVITWAGLTGKFDLSPKPAPEPLSPQLTEAEKKEISDRYQQAIAEIRINYQKHYHKTPPYEATLSIYFDCKRIRLYPPAIRNDTDTHLLEYICPSKENIQMTEAQKAQAAARAKQVDEINKLTGE
jgi:hypothetical protein